MPLQQSQPFDLKWKRFHPLNNNRQQPITKGHMGIVKTNQNCQFGWPGIDKQIEDHVRDCEACIQSGKATKPTKTPLTLVKWPKQP